MSIDVLIARLPHCKPAGKGRWRSACPIHGGDNRNAVSVREMPDGTVLLRCFVCEGAAVAIVEALGLEPSELFPPKPLEQPASARKPYIKPWPARQVLEALDMDLRVAYQIYNDISKGIAHNMTPERAKAAKGRLSRIISEIDRTG